MKKIKVLNLLMFKILCVLCGEFKEKAHAK